MDEVDVETVDVGDKVREGEKVRLGAPPVMLVRPIVRELLCRRKLDSLGVVLHRLAVGPSRGLYTPLELREFFIGGMVAERPYRIISGGFDRRRRCYHGSAADRGACPGCRADRWR